MEEKKRPEEASESSIVNRITMLLAAKRTSLAVLRTGLALLTLPFSVVTVLIATSRYYNIGDNLLFIIPLMIMNTLLVGLAVYLIVRSMKRIHLMDRLIHDLKEQSDKLMVTTDWEEEFRHPHEERP
ncbi:MAG TPA: DUF202 domain-containing protein [candidate division Zixibacteria bacterium]|nr:DUF202 domain-containing protein [candidate division Zixibacteria bacterium]